MMLVFENINELIYLYNNEKTIDITNKINSYFQLVLIKELRKRITKRTKKINHLMIDEYYEKLYSSFLLKLKHYDSRIHNSFINYCLKDLISICKNETRSEQIYLKRFTKSFDNAIYETVPKFLYEIWQKQDLENELEENAIDKKIEFIEEFIDRYANDFNKRVYQYRKNSVPIEEIAKIENISRSALCKRWYYFMKKIRKYVEEQKYTIEF